MLLAVIWHFWVGLVLAVVAGLTVLGLAAQYIGKVSSKQYPKSSDREL